MKLHAALFGVRIALWRSVSSTKAHGAQFRAAGAPLNLPERSHLQGSTASSEAVPSYAPPTHRASTVLPERIPIPESLHSIETGDPIATCLACDAPLLDGPTEYLVEKGYRQYEAYDVQETVFEYAICMDCHADMRQSFSEPSKRRCQAYLSEHVDLAARTGRLLDADSRDPADWTRQCVVHGTPRDELTEYQVIAHCQGDELLLTHLPLLMGGPAIDALAQRLSSETLDDLGGFRDEHLGLPPELKRDLQGPIVA